MTCPAGCLRIPGHFGFHTTVPAIAEREDKAVLVETAFYTAPVFSLWSLMELLQQEQPFPAALTFGHDGEIWISGPTIGGQSRVTYPKLI